MEKIRYRIEDCRCKTKCPYNQIDSIHNVIKVGSWVCADCKYYSNCDEKNKLLYCKYKEMNKMEMTKDEALEKIVNMEKELEKLKGYVEKKDKKAWPDTLEEMRKESEYWGFANLSNNKRYLLSSGAQMIVNHENEWCCGDEIKYYIENNGDYDIFYYEFIKFDTAKELYTWMAEGKD